MVKSGDFGYICSFPLFKLRIDFSSNQYLLNVRRSLHARIIYNNDVIVKETLQSLYTDPLTQTLHHITISYEYNDNIPTALENRLLRALEYAAWEEKEKLLIQMYSTELSKSSHQLWPAVTGLQFHTAENGEILWTVFEDTEFVVVRIPDSLIPSHIARVQLSEVTDHCVLAGPVSTGVYDGHTFAIKAHDHSYQNSVFPAEFRAFITLGKVSHVVELSVW
jgi:hypothetical protein